MDRRTEVGCGDAPEARRSQLIVRSWSPLASSPLFSPIGAPVAPGAVWATHGLQPRSGADGAFEDVHRGASHSAVRGHGAKR
jgi:hypothetical protein